MGNALVLHNRLNIGKVEVDECRSIDEVGNTLNTLLQNLIRLAESFRHRRATIDNLQETVIRNNNQGIHSLAQTLNTREGIRHTLLCLKTERLRNDTDRQYAHFLRNLRNNRSRTGTGTAAHTAGDEDHISTLNNLGQFFLALLGSLLSNVGLGTCAETFRQFLTYLNALRSSAVLQMLLVRVDANEFNAHDPLFDHTVHRVVARAADTDYQYLSSSFVLFSFDFNQRCILLFA